MGQKTAGGTHFHSMLKAVTDTDDRPKTKPAKKDAAPDNAAVAAVPVAAQRVATPPITFNIFPANDAADKKDGDDSEAASTADEKAAPMRIAGVSVQPRLSAEERGAANQQAKATDVGRPASKMAHQIFLEFVSENFVAEMRESPSGAAFACATDVARGL